MEKSLSERIAASAVNKKSPQAQTDKDNNRAVFLTLRSEIKQALEDGWPITSIWKTLHKEGKVTFGYDSFRRYTRRLILSPAGQNPRRLERPNTGKTAKPKTNETSEIKGFTFNPIPNKEELF